MSLSNIQVGSLVEERFVTWNHFIPFPRGYIFWKPEDENKKSVFLQFKKLNVDEIEHNGRIICDVGNFFTDPEYTKSSLSAFHKNSKGHAIELRMRESSLQSKNTLNFLFQRHNGFLGTLSDVMTESLIFLSCCYGWDENAELSEEMSTLRENGVLTYEQISYMTEKEPFSQYASCDLDFGAKWKENSLGPFYIFEKNNYWHVALKEMKEVIMKNFLFKLDAQLNTESLFSFYNEHYYQTFFDQRLSVLDLLFFDTLPFTEGIVRRMDIFNDNF